MTRSTRKLPGKEKRGNSSDSFHERRKSAILAGLGGRLKGARGVRGDDKSRGRRGLAVDKRRVQERPARLGGWVI